MSFYSFPLLLPQPGETGGRAEFPRLGLLVTSNINGFLETFFGFNFNIGLLNCGLRL